MGRHRSLAATPLFSLPMVVWMQNGNSPAVESAAGISTYSSLWTFDATSSAVLAGTTTWPVTYSTSSQSVSLYAGLSQLMSKSVQPWTSKVTTGYCSSSSSSSSGSSSSCATRCSNSGGAYSSSSNTCTQYYKLQSICVVVNPATGLLDTSWNNNAGCAAVGAISNMDSSLWSSISATAGVGPFGYSAAASSPQSGGPWGSLTVTVRSSADPYVTALRTTGGDPSSFGLSVGQKVGMGIGLIAAGGALMGIIVLVAYCIIRIVRGRKASGGGGGTVTTQAYVTSGAVPVTSPMPPHYGGAASPSYPYQQQAVPQQPPQAYYPAPAAGGYPAPQGPYPPQASPYPPQAAYAPQAAPYPPQPYAYPQPQAPGYGAYPQPQAPAYGYPKQV